MLAPAFGRRSEIVPNLEAETAEEAKRPGAPAGAEPPVMGKRFPWASLLWRVFLTDALACPECDGRMRVVAVVTSTAGVTRFLAHAGLCPDAPRVHPPRPPPQQELPFDQVEASTPDPGWDAFDPDPSGGMDFPN